MICFYICRAPLETGSPVEDIITTNLGEPEGLAVDWVNRQIYWTDGGRSDSVNIYMGEG